MKLKYMLAITASVIVGFSFMMVGIRSTTSKEMINFQSNHIISSSNRLAREFSTIFYSDIEKMKNNISSKDLVEDETKIYSSYLEKFRKTNNFEHVYIGYKDGNGDYRYLVDSDHLTLAAKDPEIEFGNKIKEYKDIEDAYSKKIAHSSDVEVQGENIGDTLTVYIPVLNENKEVSFVLAVEGHAEIVNVFKDAISKKIIIYALAALAAIYAIIVLLFRTLSSNIVKISSYVQEVYNNNLSATAKIDTKDELGRLQGSLLEAIHKIKDIIVHIRKQMFKNKDSINNISEHMNEFQDSYSEIIDFMSKTTTQVENITLNTDKILGSTEEISTHISSTSKSFFNLNTTINKISALNDKGSVLIEELSENIALTQEDIKLSLIEKVNNIDSNMKQILPVVLSIKNISYQVSLLALNASIEASRAGEAGAGFSVIADEIRKLSTQTDEITKKIIDNMNNLSHDIQTTKEDSLKVEERLVVQKKKASDVTIALNEITSDLSVFTETFEKVLAQIQGIDASKEELLSSVENIASSVQETHSTTENVLSVIQEKSYDIEKIQNILRGITKDAENIVDGINVFKVD